MVEGFDITKHKLVPEHIKLSEEEKQKIMDAYNLLENQFPKIFLSDPAIQKLKPEVGNIIKIRGKSPTTIKSTFYRVVVHG